MGSGGDLNHLLVPPLDGAVPLVQVQDVPVLVPCGDRTPLSFPKSKHLLTALPGPPWRGRQPGGSPAPRAPLSAEGGPLQASWEHTTDGDLSKRLAATHQEDGFRARLCCLVRPRGLRTGSPHSPRICTSMWRGFSMNFSTNSAPFPKAARASE